MSVYHFMWLTIREQFSGLIVSFLIFEGVLFYQYFALWHSIMVSQDEYLKGGKSARNPVAAQL